MIHFTFPTPHHIRMACSERIAATQFRISYGTSSHGQRPQSSRGRCPWLTLSLATNTAAGRIAPPLWLSLPACRDVQFHAATREGRKARLWQVRSCVAAPPPFFDGHNNNSLAFIIGVE